MHISGWIALLPYFERRTETVRVAGHEHLVATRCECTRAVPMMPFYAVGAMYMVIVYDALETVHLERVIARHYAED
jgi:hypothetical protein